MSSLSDVFGPKAGSTNPSPFDVGDSAIPEAQARTLAEREGRVDAICDRFLAEVGPNRAAVAAALEAVEERLHDFGDVAETHDAWVDDVRTQLARVVTVEDAGRVDVDHRSGVVTIDGRTRVERLHADRQLALVLLPVLRRLGAPRALLEMLSQMAGAAPHLSPSAP